MVLLASDHDKSRFLKADDIDGERKFRIKTVTEEVVGADKENKLVVWFTNDKRGFIVNKTNNRVLRGAFGDDTAGWANEIIIIFKMMVPLGGKMVPGLRVRIPPPKQSGVTTAAKPSQPSGNSQTAAAKPKVKDDELDDIIESPPAQSLSDELNDEIDF